MTVELKMRISAHGHQYFVEENGKIKKVFYKEADALEFIRRMR